MLTTSQKGAVAETAIAYAATRLGIDVYRPVTDGGRCDLIFDLGPRLLRVQCKWASRYGDAVWIRCYSSRRTANGLTRRKYGPDEIDVIAAYCHDNGKCYLLPGSMSTVRSEVRLRLVPSRNNQVVGVHQASEYEFESLDWSQVTGP
jgi:PD-(D/E)XK nuclease superfamily protein